MAAYDDEYSIIEWVRDAVVDAGRRLLCAVWDYVFEPLAFSVVDAIGAAVPNITDYGFDVQYALDRVFEYGWFLNHWIPVQELVGIVPIFFVFEMTVAAVRFVMKCIPGVG